MNVTAASGAGGSVGAAVLLESAARALAKDQLGLERAARFVAHIFEPPPMARALERAHAHFVGKHHTDATPVKAAEWYLDNYYLIRRVARQVEGELPRGFVRHLPELASGPSKGLSRIDALARTLVARSDLTLDPALIRRFIDAYQEVSPLTIAELWALPTMLRSSVIYHLLRYLGELDVPVHDEDGAFRPNLGGARGVHEPLTTPLAPTLGVERSIRALRVLDAINWQSFFEKTNRVESILRTDPARVYSTMDFESCDAYRKVVESLAWATGSTEEEVALLAVDLAQKNADDPRRGHVGYYLVATGRSAMEASLGYRPLGLDRLRRAVTAWPTTAYLAPLAGLTLALLSGFAVLLHRAVGNGHFVVLASSVIAFAVPASGLSVSMLQWFYARLLSPRVLPKLDLRTGLPPGLATLVVMPTLLGRSEDVVGMLRQLELHYLSNPDPRLQFALLTDDVDADRGAKAAPALRDAVSQGIRALNDKHGRDGEGPFHLLHRSPVWNPSEARFMGWERKRGKLEELNRLLRGDETTSFSLHVGAPAGLTGIRFVITLDGDTGLPIGAAHALIGLLAHPLNRAVFDDRTGRVTAGYTIVQPRIETSPADPRTTRFSRAFAGDVGFDIYTRASSDLYQDLFGAGIYVGKGIYDVDDFMRSVHGSAPENALVSHDLFEGAHGRAALATDIVLFEGYPSSYVSYAMRLHRWVRGDWQLGPWMFSRVPSADLRGRKNTLSVIDRWKIADNLRRSLLAPSLTLLLVIGLCEPAVSPWLVIFGVLGALLLPVAPSLLGGRRALRTGLTRYALFVVFLVYEAYVTTDAVVRTIFRQVISRRLMLQWTSAAHAEWKLDARSRRASAYRAMAASPVLSIAIGAALALVRPSALPVAAPLLLLFFVAPEVARFISEPDRDRAELLSDAEKRRLRLLARKTWRFFEAFVGPNEQWLPIDNFQAAPREQTAHRTSPTNIGLMLTSTLSAYDFGYIGPGELSLRVRRALDSVTRMQHYQGHLFNWYDTRDLQPLLPRYVSTVDSGNFAGCLVTLRHGLLEVADAPVVRTADWDGIRDSIDLLDAVVTSFPGRAAPAIRAVLARARASAISAGRAPSESHTRLCRLTDMDSPELDGELRELLEEGDAKHQPEQLAELRTSIDKLHQQLVRMRRELDALLPWLWLTDDAALFDLRLPNTLRLSEIPASAERLRAELALSVQHGRPDTELARTAREAAAERLERAFKAARENAQTLRAELVALADRALVEVRGMDWKLLYDSERKLFHIGYNATVDVVDAHYYDLLASEARLASYMAIALRDVPESHWYALGRPMTVVTHGPFLLSWGGTMFEYLMPSLLMKSQDGTLLARTYALAVDAQIEHGRSNRKPWGVSESSYARVDAHQTYQYQSFGVPGLGFRRGLEEDHVVTPYASLLALSVRPRAVVQNLSALEAHGMVGTYGLFEALDFTEPRAHVLGEHGQGYAVVRSYMAHHQGMLLISIGNFLNERSMVDRFHADPVMQTGEALLNELAPDRAPREWPIAEAAKDVIPAAPPLAAPPQPWTSAQRSGRQAFPLTNGHLTTVVTDEGGGGLTFRGLALTRYVPDPTRDDDGVWFYLRDEETREVWLASSALGRTTYSMHKVELHLRNMGISVHIDVAVAAADDVEVRQITLHNETNRPRTITITSAGRPVLFGAKDAAAHPAFSSMFVESEWVPDVDGLVFSRRKQKLEEEGVVLVHRLVHEGTAVSLVGHESDRAAFYGRGGSRDLPRALSSAEGRLGGHTGAVLDPTMSLMARVRLKPKGSACLAFVTTASRSRSGALALAKKYGSMLTVRWCFRDAEQEAPRRLARTNVSPSLLPSIQHLYSAMLFADPELRAAGPAASVPARQRQLWGLGISGDLPIVLLSVSDPDKKILGELVASQRYLRDCGIQFDLVVVDERASGYLESEATTLHAALTREGAEEWLGRPGGVATLSADQLKLDELHHLEACARLVFTSRDSSLAGRLAVASTALPELPRFEGRATVAEGAESAPDSRLEPRPELMFDNGKGGFSADGREYVIVVPKGDPPPAPWCNVLANSEFGCLVSESSFDASWSKNSGENRLTPWRNDPVLDVPSEALYLRDEETAAVWSTTPLPAGQSALTLVRHGAGYTTYERESHGLVQELTVFVPKDAALKVVRLRLRNTLPESRRVTATYYAEWVLGTRRELQRPYITSSVDRDHACIMASCSWSTELGGRVAFLAASEPIHGFSVDRLDVLGRRGDYARPEGLERWGLNGRIEPNADPCAALQVHLDIASRSEVLVHFVLGEGADTAEALALITRFRAPEAVTEALLELHAHWNGILDQVRVKTPEPSMDLMLNRWLLYQTISARLLGRTAFYQSSGAFGFRDQLQDIIALVHAAPSLARAHIVEASRHQFEQGDVLHWWHPPSGRGVRTRCSDDMAWLPFATGEYVNATGDAGILDEATPFLSAPVLRPGEHDRYAEYEPKGDAASLYEHCKRALDHALTAGSHGLPLMGDGDWNDGMSRVGSEGRGESVWLAWFLAASMTRFASLADRRGDTVVAASMRARTQSLIERTEDVAWDGEWYLRAYHDDGSILGSKTNRECRIDSIVQSWAVLSRDRSAPKSEHARTAVRSADHELVRPSDRLIRLFWPPFDTTLHDPGYIRAYPPGIRENGGQYTHAATWLGFAHASMDDGGGALRIFNLLNPALRTTTRADMLLYRVEPYVLAGDIYGAAPWVGRGGWTWYTGAAAWMWRLGVEEILGIRCIDGDLDVDPCIDPSWPGFEAWVTHERGTVHVIVENPEHVSRGVAEITLDGAPLPTTRVLLKASDTVRTAPRELRVRLGKKPPP